MLRYFTPWILLFAIALPATGETVLLKNGDPINGTIIEQNDEQVILQHDSLGQLTIPRDNIQSMGSTSDVATDAPADTEVAYEGNGILGTGFLKNWEHAVEGGVTGAEGNSTNFKLRVSYQLDYEDESDRWDYDFLYRYGTKDNDVNEDDFTAGVIRDWLIPDSPLFYFARAKFEYDDFKDWDVRVSGSVGLGDQIVETDKYSLRGRLGIGANYLFGADDPAFTGEALLGIEAEYQLTDNQSIEVMNEFYPDLTNFGEFRNITTASWVIKIDHDKGLSLRLGLENEYDSNAHPREEEYDFTYFATLIWDF